MGKILIVEDDVDIQELEKDYLEAAGYQVETMVSGENVTRRVSEEEYDLILLDIMLPKISGYEICQKIREQCDMPIIFVSARNQVVDIVRGLGLGSDDYITKPFDPAILVARVKASIENYRRHKALDKEILVQDIKIVPENRQVFRGGREIKMTNREFELLEFLALHANKVYSKADLFEAVWGMNSLTDDTTITVHINRIREKIEEDPTKPRIIQTVWGTGYRLCRETS